MINILILKNEFSKDSRLQDEILNILPQVSVTISRPLQENWPECIKKIDPELIFIEIENCPSRCLEVLQHCQDNACETILVSSKSSYIFEVAKYRISGYLLKPIDSKLLENTLRFALERIANKEKRDVKKQPENSPLIIGIPTMEGYEFVNVEDIIRCESYLKCTRVITLEAIDIISSYNIGEFVKSFEHSNFFRPHQSHLININKVKKYLKEGTIIMQDDSFVPVSRRKRSEFVNTIPHI